MHRKLVSRYGLTRCPHCLTHVRALEASCVSCGGALDGAPDGAFDDAVDGAGDDAMASADSVTLPSQRSLVGALRRGLARSRGGIIAASLLGLSSLAGCDDRPIAVDGSVADKGAVDQSRKDGQGVDGTQSDLTVDMRSDIPPQPPYGIPPSPDAGVDARPLPPDGGMQPLYGATPIPRERTPRQ